VSPPVDSAADGPVGAHGLGPHVVGRRVVVRRLVRGEVGPTGGPAMTDLLGTCLSWADGVCVVQPETGTPVAIATRDIVSGKPVPPRPSPRLRLSPAQAQHRAMTLFPDLETEQVGGWTLRHSPTHDARRANSVLAMSPGDLPVEASYEAVVGFYEARGRRPIAAVLPGTAEEAVFVERGWVPESGDAETVFELSGVAVARRAVATVPEPDDLVVEEDGDLAVVRLGSGEGERASGVAALDGDWVGYRGIVVAPEHRRRGLGLAVMAALLGWSAQRGATTAYLQVLGDNAPALALYERLGFVEHHHYRYLAAPLD